MRNARCRTWNMVRNTEKVGKWESHMVRREICRETLKTVKNERCTFQDLE